MNPVRHFRSPAGPPASGGAVPSKTPIDHTWLVVFGDVVHMVIVFAVLAAALLALRMWVRGRVPSPVGPNPLAELEVLYARGEVTRDDYLARRADLAHGGQLAS